MKKLAYSSLAFALAFPLFVFAQQASSTVDNSTIQTLFASLINLINKVLVPLVFALAFLLFLFGVFKYFFAGDSDDKRKEGRKFVMWGIIALAVMICVWGLVNILVRTFNLDEARPCLPTFSPQRDC